MWLAAESVKATWMVASGADQLVNESKAGVSSYEFLGECCGNRAGMAPEGESAPTAVFYGPASESVQIGCVAGKECGRRRARRLWRMIAHQEDTEPSGGESAGGFTGADPRQSRAATGPPVQLNHRNVSVCLEVAANRWRDRVSAGLRGGIGGKVGKRRWVFRAMRGDLGKIPG